MHEPLHPSVALFPPGRRTISLPPCDHYAGSEKLIRKALALQSELGPVFDVTCDCEDGAPAGSERAHAEMVADLIASSENRFLRAGVRIHDAKSPFWRDEAALFIRAVGSRLPYITLPKAESAAQVEEVVCFIRAASASNGLAHCVPLHVLIETPTAVAEAGAIAAIPEVETLDFGLLDFISEHQGAIGAECMRSPAQFTHRLIVRAKTELAAEAHRYGKIPVHNITVDLRNAEQTFADARRARDEFGFLRMWSIHPSQIRPIVDAMAPDMQDVRKGESILLAAQKVRWAPISFEGELHDRASYRYFWNLLERAMRSGAMLSDEALRSFFTSSPAP